MLVELLVRDEPVVEAVVEVKHRLVVVRFEQRELFRSRRPGRSDCLFGLSKLRPARVCKGVAALAAKRVIVVPLQKRRASFRSSCRSGPCRSQFRRA